MVEADKMIMKRVKEGGGRVCITLSTYTLANLPNEDTLLEDIFHYRCVYKGHYLQEWG